MRFFISKEKEQVVRLAAKRFNEVCEKFLFQEYDAGDALYLN